MALSVQDTSAATGTGTNGTDHAMDKLTSGGALRKLPGDSTWTFIPALPESALSLPCMRSAPLVSSAPSATRDHADRSTPLRTSTETNVAARTASGARPLAVQSDYYDKTPLFSEGFENGAVTQNTWVSTGTLDAPQWGRATNSCAKVFAGGWSESPVGNPGSGAPYCFGYSGVPNPANGTELSQINSITIGHYKAAELSFWRWIDTYSDNSSWDALYLFYSTDGGSHYVNASGANGIAGEDRLWRRELLTLDTQGGLT